MIQGFTNEKYNFISSVRDSCVKISEITTSKTQKIDKIVLNKWFAIPIFAVIMSFVYILSVGVVGKFATELLNELFENLSSRLENILFKLGASVWAVSLVSNGIFAGMTSVLSFVPQLLVIFLCLSVLETTGYMSRIAFMFDRVFRKFGLSGKSLVPFIVGTACSVPAITMSKTIESKDEKEMTVILSPFVPCAAKLPIIALFAGFFFPNNSGLITASLYFLSVLTIIFSALILKKFIYKNQTTSFISELPEYKMPNLKYVSRDVFDKTKDFIYRAGTIIVFCSVLVWFLSSFNFKFQFACNIQESMLAGIGNIFAWFFYPIVGEWNWAVSVSAIQGIIAKEQVVSSMTVISGLSQISNVASVFESAIFSGFTKLSAYSFVSFNLFSAPCISAIGAMKNELKSTRKTISAVIFQIVIAWILSASIFMVGSLIF